LLNTVVLQDGVEDRWHWNLHPTHNSTVSSAYQLLSTTNTNPHTVPFDLIWHKVVPLKVCLFAWCLLQNRISTTNNLTWRGVFHNLDQLCSGGCSLVEDVDNLFLNCGSFGSIWPMVSHWVGINTVYPAHIIDHLLQFRHLGGPTKNYQITMHLICLSCT